ncbi:MAG: Mov34/MPN/PAD-1 family protein [Candidatus Hodarchaeales archaeon]|jgi:proteasome lid subunit RPN8/RPN11
MAFDKNRENLKIEKSNKLVEKAEKLPNGDSDPENYEVQNTQISLVSSLNSVTILAHLLDDITEYSIRSKPREAIGLLGGKEIRKNEIIISKILFVSEGDEVSVSFSDDDFSAFEEILEKDSYCLGWWHSHPGYGLFLSNTDISTHIYSFQLHNNLSVALVVDPTKIELNNRAIFKFYQVIGEQDQIPFHYKEIASYIK